MAIAHSVIPLVGGRVHYVLLTEVVYHSKQARQKCNRRGLWPFHRVQSLLLEAEFITSRLRRLCIVPSMLHVSVTGGIFGHSTHCNPSEAVFITSRLRRLSIVPSTLHGSVIGVIFGHSTHCNPFCWRRSSLRSAYECCLRFQAGSTEV